MPTFHQHKQCHMTLLTCLHCMNPEVPNGAKVCRGCQAQIEYGAPKFAIALAIFLPFFIAHNFGLWIHDYVGYGIIVAGIVLLPLGWLSWKVTKRLYSNRTNFKRWYR